MLLFFFILFSLLSPLHSRAIISTRNEKPEEPPKLDDAFVLKQIVSKCRFVEIWDKLNQEDRKIADLSTEHISNYTDPLKLEDDLYWLILHKLDLSTEKDGAVFWSGKRRAQAEPWARNNTKKTLELTKGGEHLDALGLFGNSSVLAAHQACCIWELASLRFASLAYGEANVFSTGTSRVNAWGNVRTWFRVEKPILLSSPRVTYIYRRRKNGKVFAHYKKKPTVPTTAGSEMPLENLEDLKKNAVWPEENADFLDNEQFEENMHILFN